MTVSIIIPTHDNYDCFKKNVKLLYYNLEKKNNFFDFEVILVDNNADKDTKEYCQYASKHYNRCKVIVNTENLDFSRVNNQAVKQAKGDYFLLLNDDVLPTKDWLIQMLQCAQDNDAGITGCYQFNPETFRTTHAGVAFNDKHQPFHALYNTEPYDVRTLKTKEVQAVTFSCVLIKRKAWFELDGFTEFAPDPECFYQFEDMDFCMRAKVKGIKIMYCAEARVGHWVAKTSSKVNKSENNYKNLPRFIEQWKFVAKPDREEYETQPEGQPDILIGIPISERYEWCLEQLVRNLAQQNFNHQNLSICFAVNNSGENFWEKLMELGNNKLVPSGFKEVYIPKKITLGMDKNQSIVDARNYIRETAKELKSTHILYWDCDVMCEPDAIEKLLKINTPETPITCGAVMFKSSEQNKPMLFTARPEYNTLTFEDYLNTLSDLEMEDVVSDDTYYGTGLGLYRFCPELIDGQIHEVGAAGMGCTLVRREVADFIPFAPHQRGFGTEDLWWFFQAQKMGYKTLCDTSLKTYHFTKGRIYDYQVPFLQG